MERIVSFCRFLQLCLRDPFSILQMILFGYLQAVIPYVSGSTITRKETFQIEGICHNCSLQGSDHLWITSLYSLIFDNYLRLIITLHGKMMSTIYFRLSPTKNSSPTFIKLHKTSHRKVILRPIWRNHRKDRRVNTIS
jgi:hypothetical protein